MSKFSGEDVSICRFWAVGDRNEKKEWIPANPCSTAYRGRLIAGMTAHSVIPAEAGIQW